MPTRKNYGFPIVPHRSADKTTECDGCIVVDPADKPYKAKVYCSTCDVLYATVPWLEVSSVLVKLMGATVASDRCPHCGALHTFPGFDQMLAYTCEECGEPVQMKEPPTQ